jgi:hypothetical protein
LKKHHSDKDFSNLAQREDEDKQRFMNPFECLLRYFVQDYIFVFQNRITNAKQPYTHAKHTQNHSHTQQYMQHNTRTRNTLNTQHTTTHNRSQHTTQHTTPHNTQHNTQHNTTQHKFGYIAGAALKLLAT